MIKGKMINLRVMREKDIETFEALYNDIENRGDYYYMGLEPESVMRKRYKENGCWDDNFGRLLIVDKEDAILGYINFFKSVAYFSSYEIGYRLFEEKKRRKGIMTEAVKLLCGYLFSAKNVNRLEIRTHPDNIASQKVALKAGFTREGNARGAVLEKDTYIDMCQFSLTRQDFYSGDNNDRS
ncbi:MAG: GNAT family N-acetyltransferase [Spirochaetales bacterium]|nr:GNAT family N-acetyltransferase [Spirochaetales bacterium]